MPEPAVAEGATREVEVLALPPLDAAMKETPTAGVTPAGTPIAFHLAADASPRVVIVYATPVVIAELSILTGVPLGCWVIDALYSRSLEYGSWSWTMMVP